MFLWDKECIKMNCIGGVYWRGVLRGKCIIQFPFGNCTGNIRLGRVDGSWEKKICIVEYTILMGKRGLIPFTILLFYFYIYRTNTNI